MIFSRGLYIISQGVYIFPGVYLFAQLPFSEGRRLKFFYRYHFFWEIESSSKIQFKGIYESNNHSFQDIDFLKLGHPYRCMDKKWNSPIVARDFNFDLLKYGYNNIANDFLSTMYSNFFQLCILEPTRITSNYRPSLLG